MEDAKLYCIRIVTLHPLPPHSKTEQNQKNPANSKQIMKWRLREAACVSDLTALLCGSWPCTRGAGQGDRLTSCALLAHTNFNKSLTVFHVVGP